MRAHANELQRFCVRLPVDQHQVRLDVAITVILPIARERMVVMPLRKWLICCKSLYDRHQIDVERRPVLSLGGAFIVPLELAGSVNSPHASLPSVPQRYRTS